MSDDGQTAIVIIALLGNPFSPAYARARSRGPADALGHCAMNVAVYAKRGSAWALEERRVPASDRAAGGVEVGTSTLHWDGDQLIATLDERTTPFGRSIRGRVVLHPETATGAALSIDERGDHLWWPVAPVARIEVNLPSLGVRFRGHGYHDANAGEVPLDATFERWSWSRARANAGALLTYDVACSSGAQRSLAFRVASDGRLEALERTRIAPLSRTSWGLARETRVDHGGSARVTRSLEDGPFYARALVETRLGGAPIVAMHEALAVHRLRQGWVRALTSFRMRKG